MSFTVHSSKEWRNRRGGAEVSSAGVQKAGARLLDWSSLQACHCGFNSLDQPCAGTLFILLWQLSLILFKDDLIRSWYWGWTDHREISWCGWTKPSSVDPSIILVSSLHIPSLSGLADMRLPRG